MDWNKWNDLHAENAKSQLKRLALMKRTGVDLGAVFRCYLVPHTIENAFIPFGKLWPGIARPFIAGVGRG